MLFGLELEYEVEKSDSDSEPSLVCAHTPDGPCHECAANSNCDPQELRCGHSPEHCDYQLLWGCGYCEHEHEHYCYEDVEDDDKDPPYPERSKFSSREYIETNTRTAPIPQDWVIKDDGSLKHGYELNTPPLDSEFWLPDRLLVLMEKVLPKLQDCGAYVENTCGLHVHVETFSKLSQHKALRALTGTVANNEDILYFLAMGDSFAHRGTRYCSPMSVSQVKAVWNHSPSRNAFYPPDRYYGMNSYVSDLGTVEFRYFNATLSPKIVVAHSLLCVGLMSYAQERLRVMPPCPTVEEFLHRLGIKRTIALLYEDVLAEHDPEYRDKRVLRKQKDYRGKNRIVYQDKITKQLHWTPRSE